MAKYWQSIEAYGHTGHLKLGRYQMATLKHSRLVTCDILSWDCDGNGHSSTYSDDPSSKPAEVYCWKMVKKNKNNQICLIWTWTKPRGDSDWPILRQIVISLI